VAKFGVRGLVTAFRSPRVVRHKKRKGDKFPHSKLCSASHRPGADDNRRAGRKDEVLRPVGVIVGKCVA
jgi:hypothetical protein